MFGKDFFINMSHVFTAVYKKDCNSTQYGRIYVLYGKFFCLVCFIVGIFCVIIRLRNKSENCFNLFCRIEFLIYTY